MDDTTAPVAAQVDRDVVTAVGPEAGSYLQGQLSQDVSSLVVGASTRAFLLAPQGKVVSWLRVTRVADDEYLLDADAGAGPAILDRLNRFRLRTKVELASETWHTLALRGSGTGEVASLGADAGTRVVPCGWPGVEGVDLLAPDVEPPSGVPVLDPARYERVRVRAGVPAFGSEFDESTIPAELGAWVIDASVSFTKGCYTGQELVARVDSRGGNVPRPLRGLLIRPDEATDRSALEGATIRTEAADKDLGRVGTVVVGDDPFRFEALAVVSRTVEVGGEVIVDAAGSPLPAEVVGLPFPSS